MCARTYRGFTLTLLLVLIAAESWAAATPTFQALGYSKDLVVTTPTRLLSGATFIKPDASFGHANFYSSMARDPISGKIYVVAMDLTNGDSHLGQLDFTTGAATTIGTIPAELVTCLAFDGRGQLYGLTTNDDLNPRQTVLAIDTRTAAVSVVGALDSHGGGSAKTFLSGAIAWNPADGYFYYANWGGDGHLFVDKLAPGTFNQTPILTGGYTLEPPVSMTFVAGRLWLTDAIFFSSADAKNIANGFTEEGNPIFPTPDVSVGLFTRSILPTLLSCIPSATTACLYNRFKVEVTYDARPQNGSGPGSVIIESRESVKFSFLSSGSIELVVKILNDCTSSLKKWRVFVGGLTDLGVSIKVTDTVSNVVKIYSSQKGKLFQSVADTFRCP
jgi:hypothetical protein